MHQTCLNITKNSLKRKNFLVMFQKIVTRLLEALRHEENSAALTWHKKTIILFDGIQNNIYFKDYVEKEKSSFKFFVFRKKYTGLIGNL